VSRVNRVDVASWEASRDDESFLPSESEQAARSELSELREKVARLEQQMMAQYSAMAAYATIAQTNVDTARDESRHHVDRSQSTMIGLIEKVRRECRDAIAGVEHRAGLHVGGDVARIAALEELIVHLHGSLEQSIAHQRQMSDVVALLLEERNQRDGWLVTNGSLESLSLR